MTRPRKPTATKGSRGSSLKTNSKVREVREKSIIDSPHDNEHESSNEREVRAQHDEADYLESLSRSREKTPQQEEREIEREEEIERREREREREKRERARRERERENREREIEREKQLIYKIFGLEPFKKEAEKLAHDASKKFTDYRNKYNESIILLVKDMREIEREIPTNISDHEVNEFIFEDVVVKKLLR
ncbi:unnamed protein product [Rhizophagus irregularis]|nr:unnamed protein product [Rhizophagus irregularis]